MSDSLLDKGLQAAEDLQRALVEARFRRIARSLSRMELMQRSMDDSFDVTELDLIGADDDDRRFLDFYGDEGIRTALDRYGLSRKLRRAGFSALDIDVIARDDRHTLFVYGTLEGTERRERIAELLVRRDLLVPDPDLSDILEPHYEVLTIDWLMLRHHGRQFTAQRPRLPGQEAPGIGVGLTVAEMLFRVIERLSLDGLVTTAEHFHNAVMYHPEFPYFSPEEEGRFRALRDVLLKNEAMTLAQASWALEWGMVRNADGECVRWRGEAQVHAAAASLQDYFESKAYRAAAQSRAGKTTFELDREAFDERWAAEADRFISGPPTHENPDDDGANEPPAR